jgi:sec-independent protein translocase protein TatA
VLVLLFGAKKLPDLSRSLGRSMRIFKSEVKEMQNDDREREEKKPETPPAEPRGIEGTLHRAEQPEAPRQPVPEADRRDS